MLFIGSILPFLIAEIYLQDYVTIGDLALLSSAILTSCFIIEHLKEPVMRWSELRNKKIDYFDWTHKKEEAAEASSYYFQKNLW
jgi:hypothetical protein